MDSIQSVTLNNIEIQENGIIRNSSGYLIGRLSDDIDYNGEHIKGNSIASLPNTSSEVEIFKHYYDNPKDKNGNDKPNESLGIFTILDGQTKGEIMNCYSFSFYGKQDNGIYRVQGREVSGMYGNPNAGTICSTEKIEWITDLLHQSEIKGRINALEELPITEIKESNGRRTNCVLSEEIYKAIEINKFVNQMKNYVNPTN